ncbi:RNA polymerase sigma factor [Nocardioides caeni]|uniref:RNA polymerase sigma factor n=1 Tax=Nocardioides caeni TaxID=574700 RepID=A0A4S8NIN1_9ACTN|nr:RNA polymerase sigma factor [Nocardioides caeni]THV16021.1 RNA polymerase sigma factor [Nocardioides caeni]
MTRSPDDDGQADVRAAQAGDEAAFARLYRATHPGLLRYVSALSGADAEDVCAEAWAQACRDLGRFRGGTDDFRAWIARIARNRATDLHRARGRRPAESLPPDAMPDRPADATTDAAALEAMDTARVLRALATLPPDQAEAVLLRVVLGLDAKRAGAVLGKRAGAVRTASYRGLRTLAATFDEDASS